MFGLTRRNADTAVARPERTEIRRWDPWSEFTRIRSEMDQLFGNFFGPIPRLTSEIDAFTPAADLYETADEVVVSAHLPGVSREDIHVEVIGDTLHISGESKPTVPEKDVTVHLAQSSYGKFDFRCSLPAEVKVEQVKATYRNGVLEIHLPKTEEAKPKPVEVKIEG
jgi:HSP20 family protein